MEPKPDVNMVVIHQPKIVVDTEPFVELEATSTEIQHDGDNNTQCNVELGAINQLISAGIQPKIENERQPNVEIEAINHSNFVEIEPKIDLDIMPDVKLETLNQANISETQSKVEIITHPNVKLENISAEIQPKIELCLQPSVELEADGAEYTQMSITDEITRLKTDSYLVYMPPVKQMPNFATMNEVSDVNSSNATSNIEIINIANTNTSLSVIANSSVNPINTNTSKSVIVNPNTANQNLAYSATAAGTYQCSMCPHVCDNKLDVLKHYGTVHFGEHIQEGSGPRKWKCPLCVYSNKDRSLIIRHFQSIHSIDQPYNCTKCNLTFCHPDVLKGHMLKCKSKGLIAYVNSNMAKPTIIENPSTANSTMAEIQPKIEVYIQSSVELETSGAEYTQMSVNDEIPRSETDTHLISIPPVKRTPIYANMNEVFEASKPEHRNHAYSITKAGTYQCSKCSQICGKKWDLMKHFRRKHYTDHSYPLSGQPLLSEKPQWKCPLCVRSYISKAALSKHVRTVHTPDRPYSCSKCKKTFKRRDNLARHMGSCKSNRSIDSVASNTVNQTTSNPSSENLNTTISTMANSSPVISSALSDLNTNPTNCNKANAPISLSMTTNPSIDNSNTVNEITKKEPQSCTYCNRTLKTPDSLKRHMMSCRSNRSLASNLTIAYETSANPTRENSSTRNLYTTMSGEWVKKQVTQELVSSDSDVICSLEDTQSQ